MSSSQLFYPVAISHRRKWQLLALLGNVFWSWENWRRGDDDYFPAPNLKEDTKSSVEQAPCTEDIPKPIRLGIIPRSLGWWASIILPLSILTVLAVTGFITWLWFSGSHDSKWSKLIVSGRGATAVSVSTFFIRLAVDAQAGIGAAMLAAIALESHGVRLADAPAVGVIRAGVSNLPDMILPLIAAAGSKISKHSITVIMLILLLITSTALQLSSTAPLSDLSIGSIPDLAHNVLLPYDFQYLCRSKQKPWTNRKDCPPFEEPSYPFVARAPPWIRAPAFFPTFAEYSEPIAKEAGVDDTGLLLRALLPLSNQKSREQMRNYSGNALVLDSRVSCHRPLFDNNTRIIEQLGGEYANVSGTVTTEHRTPLLLTPDAPIPFDCYPLASFAICALGDRRYSNDSAAADYISSRPQDKPPLSAGALKSSFSDSHPIVVDGLDGKRLYSWGAAYLVMMTTIHSHGTSLPEGVSKSGSREHWLDLTAARAPIFSDPMESRNVSFTLCYAAWDTARLPVELFSEMIRTEPTVSMKNDVQSLDFASNYSFTAQVPSNYSAILNQLGQGSRHTSEERGIMNLTKRERWIPSAEDCDPPNVRPLVRSAKTMKGLTVQSVVDQSFQSNLTVLLSTNYTGDSKYRDMMTMIGDTPDIIAGDPSLGHLFTEAMANHGSIAWTMSSLITVLSNMVYHEQYMQYRTSTTVMQVSFTDALFPRLHRGFYAFIALIITHLITVSLITTIFVTQTRYTILGDTWKNIAQIVESQQTTGELITLASMDQITDVGMQLRKRRSQTQSQNPRVRLAKVDGDRITLLKQAEAELSSEEEEEHI